MPAPKIDYHYESKLGPWYIDIPYDEADNAEPAHVHVINVQTSFRGKIWVGADENVPRDDSQRYHFVLERNTAAAINKGTQDTLLEALTRVFRENKYGITNFFETGWRGGWYHNY